MAKEESSIKYEIINEIGVISEEGKWRLELNRISWNENEPNTTSGNGLWGMKGWERVLH